MVDTNVLISGIFFSGPPSLILKAWRDGHLQFVLSPEILDEYYRVARSLEEEFPATGAETIVTLIAANSEMVQSPRLPCPVCDDPDDDKFLACALVSKRDMIVSGDKHLLKVSDYGGITVVRPGVFVEQHLKEDSR
ncbi:MAG: putative toxin-antitoxin system toxin component, PIN family [Chloroflexi bacterium]|nr:putative toxin-antitoxin system toxin component, PIN family [Chloroflexota bacterium]